jgi:hypothetical protein
MRLKPILEINSVNPVTERNFIESLQKLIDEVGEEKVMRKINTYLEGENYTFRVYKKRVNKKDRSGHGNLEKYMTDNKII